MAVRTDSLSLLASFQSSYTDLVRYLARRTGSAESARDAAHDTWLRVADMARAGLGPQLQEEGEARAYLFAVARNLVIDQQRRDGLEHRHVARQAPYAHSPDVAESAMYRQAITAVEGALAALPERARHVFVRNRLHGEDQAALAAEFGVSRNMIERDMMLAMDRVQVAMEQWCGGGGTPPAHAADVLGAKGTAVATGPASASRAGRRRSLSALLGVAGVAVGGLGGWRWWQWAVPQWQQVASTGHGQTLRRPLPDGSILTLDAQSRVAMAYYAARRSVRLLEGAAFFEVAHQPECPFAVDVPRDPAAAGLPGDVRITVLGTRFGVERGVGGAVRVQVESGRVRVETLGGAGQPVRARDLGAGDDWQIDSRREVALGHLSDPGAAAGWRHGVVVFDSAPLAEVVERLRRYLPRPVEFDGAAAVLRLSGQVQIAQAEDFVRALPSVMPVGARLRNGRWYIQKI